MQLAQLEHLMLMQQRLTSQEPVVKHKVVKNRKKRRHSNGDILMTQQYQSYEQVPIKPQKHEPYPEMPLQDYIKVMQRRFGPPKQKKHPYERYSASIDEQSQTLLLPSLSTIQHESNYDMGEP